MTVEDAQIHTRAAAPPAGSPAPATADLVAADRVAADRVAADRVAADPVAADPVAPDVGALAAHLRIGVTRLARLMRRQGDTGLSPSQISALTSVELHGPMTLGALAEHERVAPPSITKVVAKLEERELVARTADPVDRRAVRISATPAGRALLADVRQRKDLWLAARLAELDDDQRARLAAALEVIDALTGRVAP